MHEYSAITCYPIKPGDTRKTAQVDCHESLGYLVKVTLLKKRFNSIFLSFIIFSIGTLRDRVRYLSKAWLVVMLLFFVTSVEVCTYCEYSFLNARVNAKTLRAQSAKNFMISLNIFMSDNLSGPMVELTRRTWEASKNVRTTAKE